MPTAKERLAEQNEGFEFAQDNTPTSPAGTGDGSGGTDIWGTISSGASKLWDAGTKTFSEGLSLAAQYDQYQKLGNQGASDLPRRSREQSQRRGERLGGPLSAFPGGMVGAGAALAGAGLLVYLLTRS